MNRMLRITVAVILSVLVAGAAAAQGNVARFGTRPNVIYAAFGVDPALVTTVGYGRVVSLLGRRFQITGDIGIGEAGWDVSDFRARLGAQAAIVAWRSLQVTGSATFITRGTENAIYRGLNFGSDFSGTAGVYRSSWFVAGEFGFDKAVISHITHTDWYRRNYYPDAKDGWYLNAGGRFHYGLTAGLALGRAELGGRAGWQQTEDFNALSPPLYVSVGIGIGF